MLHQVELSDYRNYERALFSFEPGICQILGPNGTGKSNLLEAITLMSFGRSFRHVPNSQLIAYGKPSSRVRLTLIKDELEHGLIFANSEGVRQIIHDGKTLPSFTPLMGLYPSILISPTDIELIYGSPEERRRFLNMHIAQIDPLYGYHWTRYKRALDQRNHLLKTESNPELEVWTGQMALSALYLGKAKKAFINALTPHIAAVILELSGGFETFSVELHSSLSIAWEGADETLLRNILSIYEASEKEDRFSKTTAYGPHRDDLIFNYEGHLVRHRASEGQKRGLIIALKLAVAAMMQKRWTAPLICIDDALIHLDEMRQERLIALLRRYPQVLLTLPMPLDFSFPTSRLDVASGKIAFHSYQSAL